MLRPPLLSFLLLAAGCFIFAPQSASAQPAWDLADDADQGGSSSGSASASASSGSDDETPPDVPHVPRAASPQPGWDGGSSTSSLDDERLAKVGESLKSLQPRCRAYTGGWVALQLGLTGYFAYDATTREHDRAWRTYDIMNATIAGLNSVLLLVKPMPCRSGYSKFKDLPESTASERRYKADFGARIIGQQIGEDRKFAAPQEHVVAALVAIGFGAGLLFGYEDGLRPAVQTTLGIILLAELQFATRPFKSKVYNREIAMMGKSGPPPVQLSAAPLITRTSQGLSLVGRF
jgi:hypothetical protein